MDRAVVAAMTATGSTVTSEVRLGTYNPVAPDGDPLTSVAGLADGHDLAGSVTAGALLATDLGHAADALSLEWAIPWADLGVPAGSPVDFVLASTRDASVAGNQEDHVGGPGGRVGTTGWTTAAVSPGIVLLAEPRQVVPLTHEIRNMGNESVRIDLHVTGTCGLSLQYGLDIDGDTVADVDLGRDKNADGDFDEPSDRLEPAGDSNADRVLDVGVVLPGASRRLLVEATMLNDAPSCPVFTLDVRACVGGSCAAATDTVVVGTYALTPSATAVVTAPGEAAHLSHRVFNGSAADRLLDLDCETGLAWPCEVLLDPNGDGAADDAVPLVDSDASGRPDVAVPRAGSAWVLARVTPPPTVAIGLADEVFVRLTVDGLIADVAQDSVTIRPVLVIEPSHLIDNRDARHGPAGGSTWFAHRLTNARATDEVVALTVTSPDAWPVTLFLDPDGDGRPWDAAPLDPAAVALAGGGRSVDILARVDLPAAAADSTPSRIRIDATSTTRTDMATVFDDAVVSILTLWEDQSLTSPIAEALPCGTVVALGSGLTPAAAHGMTWWDPMGTSRRSATVIASAAGRATDRHAHAASAAPGDWVVDLQASPGGLVIDRAQYALSDPLVAEGFVAQQAAVPLINADLRVSGVVRNTSWSLAPSGLAFEWALLANGRADYWSPAAGAFLPWTGVEASSSLPIALVDRASSALAGTAFLNVTFDAAGACGVEMRWIYPCGWISPWLAVASAEILPDADADGLGDAEESALGANPADADTDDDGLADGSEGAGDADGDGIGDILECDADGDGLTDGLESGIDVAGVGTDEAAGCFFPDADPSSTTDPRLADTDGGGLSDGLEDADDNGRRDAIDGDPRDGADDPMLCSVSPPATVTGLRVARRAAGGVVLSWDASARDACTGWDVHAAEALPILDGPASRLLGGLLAASAADDTAASVPLRFYLVRATSARGGPGPLSP